MTEDKKEETKVEDTTKNVDTTSAEEASKVETNAATVTEETGKAKNEEDSAADKAADVGEEERIRGGGKVSGEASRSGRRFAPYKNGEASGGGDDASKGRRVYIGNLSWGVGWQDLKDHMRSAGEVTRADIMTGHDGRSKGCGIVEYATEEEAKKAVLTLNDTELKGRQIFVREDREEKGAQGVGNRFSSDEQAQSRRVYVGNLSWDVAWQDLKDHMRGAGEVVHAEVIMEPNGRSKGCGIVEYATHEEAKEAIATLTDTELKGRMIFVREDRETSNHAGGGGQGGGRGSGSTSVYIWNLAYETSWQDLKDHCRAAGNVDQANILTGPDGRSMGCGVVVYQHPKEAARAIRELQNSRLNGRPMYLREDRAQPTGSHRGGRGGGRGGSRSHAGPKVTGESSGCQIFVGNLSFDTSWQELKDHFKQVAEVEHADVMEHPDGRKKGFGTVRFFNPTDAEKAINELNGKELHGRSLEVRLDSKA